MSSPEAFDAFYAQARERLLLETYALTGDLPASRTAVRDAFVVAWHHWRKVSRLEDPEAWVRPLAHGRAQRRHTARLWHKDKGIGDDVRATLDALSTLSSAERKALALTTLSPMSLDDIAREVGLPRADTERALQAATAKVAVERDVPSTDVRGLLEALRATTEGSRWPRSTIVRRSGTTRRRTHTLLGVGVAVAALLVSGSVVASGNAVPTSLTGERAPAADGGRGPAGDPDDALDPAALLGPEQLGRYGKRLDWSERETTTNLEGDGLVLPCQPTRFADPAGLGALVRTFAGTEEAVRTTRVKRNGKVRQQRTPVSRTRAEVTQLVELSADEEQAAAAFATSRLWYAGCLDARTQLLSTDTVRRVGDEATVLSLRTWTRKPQQLSIAVARTGRMTVTTAVSSRAGAVAARTAATGLAAAVNSLCGSPGAGACAGRPRTRRVDPYAVGVPPGLLSAVDLPPVAAARGPWVGTDPIRARHNFAATRCDNTVFRGKGVKHNLTRTFLFPEATRAEAFGLTQTVATMKVAKARDFVEEVRARIRRCGEANLGTSVDTLVQDDGRHQQLTVWGLETEISDSRTVTFLMAIMRDGNAVSQIGFTPSGDMTMDPDDFRGVAARALERLSNLPSARR